MAKKPKRSFGSGGVVGLRGGAGQLVLTLDSRHLAQWKAYGDLIDPVKFERRFKRYRTLLLKELGGEILQMAIQQISEGMTKNAPLTIAIKGQNSPLIDTKDNVQRSAVVKILNPSTAFIGVPKTSEFYQIIETIHDGGVIPVTKSMRQMFFNLWLVSIGKMDADKLTGRASVLFDRFQDWRPLRNDTTVITIPPRKFFDKVFDDPKVHAFALDRMRKAVVQAFDQAISGGRFKAKRYR